MEYQLPEKMFDAYPLPGFVVALRRIMRGEQVTAGGIVLPESMDPNQQPSCLAKVIRVGGGVETVKPGDDIVCAPWPMKGASIALRGGIEVQMIMEATDIYATFEMQDVTTEVKERWQQEDEERRKSKPQIVAPPEKKLLVP